MTGSKVSKNPLTWPPVGAHGTQLKSVEQVAHAALARNREDREASNKSVYMYTYPEPMSDRDWEQRRRENSAVQRAKSRGLNRGGANYTHEDCLG